MLHIKFGFNWPSGFMFEYNGNIHIYCPGLGHMGTWVQLFFLESLIFSPTAHFLQDGHIK